MLLPPDLRDWLPEDHMVHFILDVWWSGRDTSGFSVNTRGTGSKQYPPSMLLALLLYCYSTGAFQFPRDRRGKLVRCRGSLYLRGHASRP